MTPPYTVLDIISHPAITRSRVSAFGYCSMTSVCRHVGICATLLDQVLQPWAQVARLIQSSHNVPMAPFRLHTALHEQGLKPLSVLSSRGIQGQFPRAVRGGCTPSTGTITQWDSVLLKAQVDSGSCPSVTVGRRRLCSWAPGAPRSCFCREGLLSPFVLGTRLWVDGLARKTGLNTHS